MTVRGVTVAYSGVERGGSGQFHPPFGAAFPSDVAHILWFDQNHERGWEI